MPTGALLVWPQPQAVDAAGVPIAGAQLFAYATGTNTPQNTYADSSLVTPNLNPLIADPRGAFGLCFLDPTLTYRMKLEDADGATLWVVDGIGYTWIADQITAAVAVETARAEAEEANLLAQILAEVARAEAAEAALQAEIDAEIARAEAAEAALAAEDASLQSQIDAISGGGSGAGGTRGGTFDLSNPFSVTFTPAFTNDCESVIGAYPGVGSPPIFYAPASLDKNGSAGVWSDNFGVPVGGTINWIAFGF